jgi:hypothetical protein
MKFSVKNIFGGKFRQVLAGLTGKYRPLTSKIVSQLFLLIISSYHPGILFWHSIRLE